LVCPECGTWIWAACRGVECIGCGAAPSTKTHMGSQQAALDHIRRRRRDLRETASHIELRVLLPVELLDERHRVSCDAEPEKGEGELVTPREHEQRRSKDAGGKPPPPTGDPHRC
jgi:hypothetical protein